MVSLIWKWNRFYAVSSDLWSDQLKSSVRSWSNILDGSLHHCHPNTKGGNILRENGVHPSSRDPETWRIEAVLWPNTLQKQDQDQDTRIYRQSWDTRVWSFSQPGWSWESNGNIKKSFEKLLDLKLKHCLCCGFKLKSLNTSVRWPDNWQVAVSQRQMRHIAKVHFVDF